MSFQHKYGVMDCLFDPRVCL